MRARLIIEEPQQQPPSCRRGYAGRMLATLLIAAIGGLIPGGPAVGGEAGERPGRIVVAGGDGFAPMLFRNADGQPDGLFVDHWKLWSEKTGIEVELRLMPWSKVIPALRAGEVDAIDCVSYSAERARYLEMTRSHFQVNTYIYYHESLTGIRDLNDISGFPVGVLEGGHIEEHLRRNAPGIKAVAYASYEEMLEAARNGRLQILVAGDPIVPYLVAKSGKSFPFRRSTQSLLGTDIRVAVPKGKTGLLATIQAGLDAISEEERKTIRDKWAGVPAVSSVFPWKWFWWIVGGMAAGVALILLWNAMLRSRVHRVTTELRGQTERFHTVFDSVYDALFVHDLQGRLLDVNETMLRMYGVKREEALGMSISGDFTGPASPADTLKDRWRKVLRGENQLFEWQARRPEDNSTFWVEVHLRSIPYGGQDVILASVRDITERRRSTEELRQSEARVRSLLDNAASVVLLLSPDHRIEEFNPEAERLYGRRRDEVLGEDYLKLFVPENLRAAIAEDIRNVLAGQPTRGFENAITAADGRERVLNWNVDRVLDAKGRPSGVVAIGLDVTDSRLAEDALRKSEQHNRLLIENMPAVVWNSTAGGRTLYISPNVAAVYGYTPDEIYSAGPDLWFGRIHPEDLERVRTGFERLFAASVPFDQEYRIRHKNGEWIWLNDRATAISRQDGERMAFGVFSDVTARKRAEAALREGEERYRLLFEKSSDAVFVRDREGRLLDVNSAACQLFGYPPEKLLTMNVIECLPPEERRAGREMMKRLESVGIQRAETRALRADGSIIEVDVHTSLVDPENGVAQGIIRDISQRKRAEREQRERAEHLEEEARRARLLAEIAGRGDPHTVMIGEGPAYQEVLEFVHHAGRAPSAALILGESGTGKEIVSRSIHAASPRAARPLVVVDCAALKGELLESELFGHEKGAFTGATQAKPGLVEVADGGTLFVDEVGEMPLSLQSKLLRVLERGEYRRLGSTQDKRADIRVVAATNRDLAKEVEEGLFRQDLFYRLNVLAITLPPLRERREDIPLLAMHFLKTSRVTMQLAKSLQPRALKKLQAYAWPGNIRELANVLERAVILSGDTKEIRAEHLPPEIRKAGDTAIISSEVMSLEEAEKRAVGAALKASGGNKTKAAEVLGVSRLTLRKKIEKYGLTP